MRVYAIGDLHLSGAQPKSMDIFGAHWENHWEKIAAHWASRVTEEDAVLIPGDISWAMELSDAKVDLDAIAALPGKKVLLRGNHDYWWSSLSKVRAVLSPGMQVLQNDCITVGGVGICGTRGWLCPNPNAFTQHDEKIYSREAERLELSLKSFAKTGLDAEHQVVMMHYPPFNDHHEPSLFTELFEKYGVRNVIYGHLHGAGTRNALEGIVNGVWYSLVSCDHLGFTLLEVLHPE